MSGTPSVESPAIQFTNPAAAWPTISFPGISPNSCSANAPSVGTKPGVLTVAAATIATSGSDSSARRQSASSPTRSLRRDRR